MKFLGKHINRFKTIFDNTVIFKEVSSGLSSDDNMLIIKTNGTLVQRPITDITAELALTGYSFNGTNIVINNTEAGGSVIFQTTNAAESNQEYLKIDGSAENITASKDIFIPDNVKTLFGNSSDLQIYHDGNNSYIVDAGNGDLLNYYSNDWKVIKYGSSEISIEARSDEGVKLYYDSAQKFETTSSGINVTGEVQGDSLDIDGNADISGNLTVSTPSTSSGIYAQFVNLKGFCTLTTNYQFTEDVEDTRSPFEIALDYGSATISSSTEVTQSKLFRSAGFHVPVACNLNTINMQVTCNPSSGNITVAIVEYVPSELAADTNDHPRTIFEEVVVASSENNNKVKTVAVAEGDINNKPVAAGSHIMIMVKGDSSSSGSKAFISAAIEIKW
jgi:hypothetical protein